MAYLLKTILFLLIISFNLLLTKSNRSVLVRTWDTITARLAAAGMVDRVQFRARGRIARVCADGVACVASAGGRTFLTGDADGLIRIWTASEEDEMEGATESAQRIDAHLLGVACMRVGGVSGALGVSTSQDGVLSSWTVGDESTRVLIADAGEALSVDLCARSEVAVAVGNRGCISVVDVDRGVVRDKVTMNDANLALAVAVDAEDTIAFVGASDGTLALFDINTTTVVHTDGNAHTNAVRAVTCSRLDPHVAVSSGDDQLISQYDPRARSVTSTARGHTGPITSLQFANMSQHYFVSSATDHTIRVWDRRTMETVFQARDHSASVNGAVFLADDSGFVSASEDGSVSVYDFSSGNPPQSPVPMG